MDPNQNQQAQYPPGTYPVYPVYPGYPVIATSTSGMAIASLVMAVLGIVAVPVLGQVLSIIFGHMALREIARSNGTLRGEGLAKAGLITSYAILGLALLIGVVALAVVLIGHFL